MALVICSGIILRGSWHTEYLKDSIKSIHRAPTPVREELLRWGQLTSSNGWGAISPNADAQEHSGVEEHYSVGKWCLLSTFEISETHSIEETICKSLRLHFSFRNRKVLLLSFRNDACNRKCASVVWHMKNLIKTFWAPYKTILLVKILNSNSLLPSENITLLEIVYYFLSHFKNIP